MGQFVSKLIFEILIAILIALLALISEKYWYALSYLNNLTINGFWLLFLLSILSTYIFYLRGKLHNTKQQKEKIERINFKSEGWIWDVALIILSNKRVEVNKVYIPKCEKCLKEAVFYDPYSSQKLKDTWHCSLCGNILLATGQFGAQGQFNILSKEIGNIVKAKYLKSHLDHF